MDGVRDWRQGEGEKERMVVYLGRERTQRHVVKKK